MEWRSARATILVLMQFMPQRKLHRNANHMYTYLCKSNICAIEDPIIWETKHVKVNIFAKSILEASLYKVLEFWEQ